MGLLVKNLIVFMIDGYGANLFNRTDAKIQFGAKMLLKNGVHVEHVKPVFPTQNYPNWFSLSTGLYVENHNFTSDFMYDQKTSMLFQRDQGMNDSAPLWWNLNTAPLWYTVGKAHIDVHCYWFPACHRPHVDLIVQVPSERRHSFKQATERDLFGYLPRIMKYIKKYQSYRQQLVLLRYDGLARALRMFDEESSAAIQALSNVDAHIRKIQEEMDNFNLFDSTNLIVLSDHGLMRIQEDTQFYVDECLSDHSRIKQVVNSLSFMMVFPKEGEEDTVFFELKVCDQWAPVEYESDEVPMVNVYRKSEIPDRFNWKHSKFMSPILLITRPGVILLTRQLPSTDVSEKFGRDLKMIGGWDNELPEMQGIFMARGPAFKSDYKGDPIEIVDVYQLVLNTLGVESGHKNNGSWERIQGLLVDGWEDRKLRLQSQQRSSSSGASSSVLKIISIALLFCLII